MQFNTFTLLSLFTALTVASEPKIVTVWETVHLPIDLKPVEEVSSVASELLNFNLNPTTLVTKTRSGSAFSAPSSVKGESISTVVATATEESSSVTAAVSTSPASSDVHTGVATFYSVSADNCGTSSTDSDFVCAISKQLYDTLTNNEDISQYCGKTIDITYNGKTITVKVVDSCESCDANHLDLSPSAFQALANPDLGVIDITWVWA